MGMCMCVSLSVYIYIYIYRHRYVYRYTFRFRYRRVCLNAWEDGVGLCIGIGSAIRIPSHVPIR